MTDGGRNRVLVTGATGYVGGRLVPQLLDAGYEVRCLARTPAKVAGFPWAGAVDIVAGDVTDEVSLLAALAGCDAAYYLVHSMGSEGAFAERDRVAAATFRDAAAGVEGLRQLVYLGALGDERDPNLSPHLRSRQEVGRVLAEGPVPVTELRAAVIIGSGSASFEMLRHLVERLPAMVTPRWVRTRCQPVAIRDVLHWLVAALDEPKARGRVLEIGGADVVTYGEMMQVYAEVAHLKRRLVVPVPLLSPRLSSLWIGLVTPLPPSLGRPLVEGLSSEVVVRKRTAADALPHTPLSFRDAVVRAVRRVEHLDVATTWAGADLAPGPADPLPTDPDWAGGTLLSDRKEAIAAAPATAEDLFAVVEGIGGVHGWYVTPALWWMRGAMDRAVGGVGLRRGRRHPDRLRVGDALDFWRVEACEPPRLLRLRAEMRLPGRAWLEWEIEPLASGGARLCQRALYHPRGVWGRAYWWSLLPFHALIFGRLAHAIASRAEQCSAGRKPTPPGFLSHPLCKL